MSQILVWRCDNSGELFVTKDAYIKHLKKLAKTRREEKCQLKFTAQRDIFLNRMGQEVTTIQELINFIRTNWGWFYRNGQQHSYHEIDGDHNLIDLNITVNWRDCVSNSHSCPRNGVCNWGGKEFFEDRLPKPKGYPGWSGNIMFSIRKKNARYVGQGSAYFKDTIINIGTGSGGGNIGDDSIQQYWYDIRLFANDFPAMALRHAKTITWQAISDKKLIDFVI